MTEFANENFWKTVASITTVVSAFLLLFNHFITLTKTNDFDKLFFDKVKRAKLEILNFILGTLLITSCLYVGFSILIHVVGHNAFNSIRNISNTLSIEKDLVINFFLNTIKASFFLSLISMVLLYIVSCFNEVQKHTIKYSTYFVFGHIILGLPFYCSLFDSVIFHNTETNLIEFLITYPILSAMICTFIILQRNRLNQPKFLITIVPEEEIKDKKIIHKYVIDDKKILCSIEPNDNDNVFYVCDFSSQVYLKYERVKSNRSGVISTK
ncbi:hypothetical protein [Bacillus pseudomycoides]|uniref:hypothetical protein n=1 Tax=Bacillus pseudomycoides TaxID=64104 RepID=UPI000BEC1F12|nr:hypothetical protein [Bacillus pseudomycoides]MED4653154.1 hypothetical protein [Bacillus pseudomycoides]PEE06906.1 hypothetical protein CON86_06695 [Bacillus pseudomycoides]PEM73470.1 hypothetical protein CN632_20475 [Bacillus pseudomycoides]PGF08014.1 hypothetical protein COM59_16120 [Bacillus pseudomycoides]PHC90570.1 hypothetical protein COF63_00910 [Bacillus pseudomycoides]